MYLAREGGLLAHTVPPLDYTLLASVSGPADSDLYAKVEQLSTSCGQVTSKSIQPRELRLGSTPRHSESVPQSTLFDCE